MQLLLENWRTYVERSLLLEKQASEFTVDDLEGLLQLGKSAERTEQEDTFIKTAAKKLFGVIAPGGLTVGLESAADLFSLLYKKMRGLPNLEPDKVADFPVLHALAVEPELVRTIEDDILKNVMKVNIYSL